MLLLEVAVWASLGNGGDSLVLVHQLLCVTVVRNVLVLAVRLEVALPCVRFIVVGSHVCVR